MSENENKDGRLVPDTLSHANHGLRRRLAHGLSATALGPVVNAVIQLGSVPLLLHAWGAAKYGDWLLLSAIPSYLTLADLGFGDASGSDMCMRVAAGDKDGALQTFQSSWVLVSLVSVAALLLAGVTVWWLPWQYWLHLSSVSQFQAATVVFVLAALVVVAQQNGVAESGFRSDGNFALGTVFCTLLRLVEAIAATASALLGGGLLTVALTYLITRTVGSIAYAVYLRHKSPWIHYGVRHARLETIRRMIKPALGFIAFPLGYALSIQGLTIVIGASLGPVAVVAFSTLRTLSRLTVQLVATIKLSLWPEFSRAFGAGNVALIRRLHRYACQASLGLSILGSSLLWILGPFIYRLWIHHHVDFDAACFHVLLFAVVTNCVWDTSAIVPISANGHFQIAVTYASVSFVSLVVAWILIHPLGLVGAAIALLFTDACMTGLVLSTSLRYVHDRVETFVPALLVIPPFWRPLQDASET